jgi:ribosomal protein L37AE/L43A
MNNIRTFLCHRCNKQFTVANPEWTIATCPHCNTNHRLPNYVPEIDQTKANLVALRIILSIILIGFGLFVLIS